MKFYSIIFVLLSSNLFGSINMAEEWFKKDSLIYLMYEHHVPSDSAAQQQRADLLAMIKAMNGFVIVEDAHLPPSSIRPMRRDPLAFDPSNFFFTSEELLQIESQEVKSSLHAFCSFCSYKQIPHKNIEFRFFLTESLDLGLAPTSLVFAQTEKIAAEIRSYNDNSEFNAYYATQLKQFEDNKQNCSGMFESIHTSHEPLKTLLPNISYNPFYRIALEKITDRETVNRKDDTAVMRNLIILYNQSLINARIAHTIYEQVNFYDTIFVIAGGNHVTNIAQFLASLGYTNTATLGGNPEDFKPIDIQLFAKQRQKVHGKKMISLSVNGTILNDYSDNISRNLKIMSDEIRKIRNSRTPKEEQKTTL